MKKRPNQSLFFIPIILVALTIIFPAMLSIIATSTLVIATMLYTTSIVFNIEKIRSDNPSSGLIDRLQKTHLDQERNVIYAVLNLILVVFSFIVAPLLFTVPFIITTISFYSNRIYRCYNKGAPFTSTNNSQKAESLQTIMTRPHYEGSIAEILQRDINQAKVLFTSLFY